MDRASLAAGASKRGRAIYNVALRDSAKAIPSLRNDKAGALPSLPEAKPSGAKILPLPN